MQEKGERKARRAWTRSQVYTSGPQGASSRIVRLRQEDS